jgi:hypothetical protein
MRYIIQHLVESGASLDLSGSTRFYVENRRMQRNLERVMADPVLTSAALSGVIADHRVVETLAKADGLVRNIIMQVEGKLGRKLSRERAQKLLLKYDMVRAARLKDSGVARKLYQATPAYAA